MAPTDKKGPPKEAPKGWDFGMVEGAIVLLIILSLLSTLVPSIIKYFTSGEITFFGFPLSVVRDFFVEHSFFWKTFGYLVAGVAAVFTFIFVKKGDAIEHEEKAKVYPDNMPQSVDDAPVENAAQPMLEKWQNIVRHSESTNPSDWRFAIIEADILLDELLDQLRLPGDTIGDKLKAVERSDFLTLDSAWEAHKARNQIAHQGSGFLLNQHEARRIISLYEQVFKEFGLI